MNYISNIKLFGGARLYGPNRKCSDKVAPPARETSVSVCFKRGLKAGFAAAMRNMNINQPQIQQPLLPTINRRTLIQATEASLLATQIRQRTKTEAQWRALNQRAIQSQAREWGIPNYNRAKSALIDDFLREARRRNLVR